MKKPNGKITILELVAKILESDLPISTRNEVTRHYLLPKLGRTTAIVEEKKFSVGAVSYPTAEDVEIENNPKMKAEFEDTERLMGGKQEDEDD